MREIKDYDADVNENVRSLREENFVSKQRLFFTFAKKKKNTPNKPLSLSLSLCVSHDREERIARLFYHHHRRKEGEEYTFGKRRSWIFSHRRRFLSSPFKAFKEEGRYEFFSTATTRGGTQSDSGVSERRRVPIWKRGGCEMMTTQSSFAAWEFAQGPSTGRKGFW